MPSSFFAIDKHSVSPRGLLQNSVPTMNHGLHGKSHAGRGLFSPQ